MAAIKFPDAAPRELSSDITIQPPLSRRGKGPGLILVLDHYARRGKSDKTLDPPPLQKWAEEGYAVAEVKVPGNPNEFPLAEAIEALKKLPECEIENGFGVISYLNRIPFYVEEAVCTTSEIKAIVCYGGRRMGSINPDALHEPQLLHIAGSPASRRESADRFDFTGEVKRFFYADTQGAWFLPADENYHPSSVAVSHTRCLSFLKPLLKGPCFDLEAIWEEHTKYEFGERDVEKTMATMVAEPYVNHIPTMTGGIGRERLTNFYRHHFIFSNPPDTALELVSRTVGIDRVIDEFVFKLTHTSVVDWLTPNIPPTNLPLRIPFTSVVCLRGDRLYHEHISWDQGTVLVQLGLLPEWLRFPYAIDGKPAPEGKRYEVRTPAVGAEGAAKLVSEGAGESNVLIEEDGRGWRMVDEV